MITTIHLQKNVPDKAAERKGDNKKCIICFCEKDSMSELPCCKTEAVTRYICDKCATGDVKTCSICDIPITITRDVTTGPRTCILTHFQLFMTFMFVLANIVDIFLTVLQEGEATKYALMAYFRIMLLLIIFMSSPGIWALLSLLNVINEITPLQKVFSTMYMYLFSLVSRFIMCFIIVIALGKPLTVDNFLQSILFIPACLFVVSIIIGIGFFISKCIPYLQKVCTVRDESVNVEIVV